MSLIKTLVIIVSYNGGEWIEECLNGVLNSSIPVELIVIDNCSTDGTVEFIKSNFKNVLLFEQKENLGFGKANNIGMSYALRQNADFVFLLNQDAFVEKYTIEKLIEISSKHPDYGIISPIQLDYSGELLEHYFYKFMANNTTKSFYSDFVLSNAIKKIYDVPFIQAASWLIPINTLKKIGGFDPIFFHYGEDDNYCQRVLYHNLKIGVAPGVSIRHDSNVAPKPVMLLFSDFYYAHYVRQLYIKYGDLNYNFSATNIKIEKNKTYKLIFIGVVSFNFFKIKGGVKQLFVLNKCVKKINSSRKINSTINSNYISS
ncbi:Glycosyltransferase, GT2 family [Flavobacterium gillisiae]|uniref:Glycosyltransferase, GT2 family n=1 Tax=Flavobacterium gillisiae TaxID=150146 RepID=A0A1H4EXF1_9FLAO|nr:glycosyltransferase family 2 protein [Flavobacterium gillisiae]SEA88932.1 Glycosyltransferase, GT2 family [Flavobacterium gillisiae]